MPLPGSGPVPNPINVTMTDESPPRNLLYEVLSYDIGPESYPDSEGDYRFININMTHCTNILTKVFVGGVELDGVPGGVIQTDPGECGGAFGIALYNGYFGRNPRGYTVQVLLTPVGVPSGVVYITTSCPAYGTAICSINLSGGIGADFVLDYCHDADNTPLYQHLPDYCPDAEYAGMIVGYHGHGAYGNLISGNMIVTGGNEGNPKQTRIWAARHDNLLVYQDFLRDHDPGGPAGEEMGLLIRCNGVPGNSDAGVERIQAWTSRYSPTQVYISIAQTRADDSAIFIVSPLTLLAWAYGVLRRLMLLVAGDQLYLWVADADTGANPQLLYSATLGTPYNDDSHQYVGNITAHYTNTVKSPLFFAGPLALVGAQNPGGAWESKGAMAPILAPPWESAAQLAPVEAAAPWETLQGVDQAADVPLEAKGALASTATVPWDSAQRGWSPRPRPTGPWVAEGPGHGGWQPPASGGGSWKGKD